MILKNYRQHYRIEILRKIIVIEKIHLSPTPTHPFPQNLIENKFRLARVFCRPHRDFQIFHRVDFSHFCDMMTPIFKWKRTLLAEDFSSEEREWNKIVTVVDFHAPLILTARTTKLGNNYKNVSLFLEGKMTFLWQNFSFQKDCFTFYFTLHCLVDMLSMKKSLPSFWILCPGRLR